MSGPDSTTPSSKMPSAENFARVPARIEELEAQQAAQGSGSSTNLVTSVSYSEASSNAVSSTDLSRLEGRLTAQFKERFAKQEETIEQQARKIQSLETKLLILRAKLDGRKDIFFLFPMLPPELRRMIWEKALDSGRVIEMGIKARTFGMESEHLHQQAL